MTNLNDHKIDILVISAHPDDAEVAAGGTLLHHIALGKKVGLLDLTRGELGTRGCVDTRTSEAFEAANKLGATFREQLNLPDGLFTFDEENVLKIVTKIRKYQPEIILTTSTHDRHPDHSRTANMVVQAAFLANLTKLKSYDFENRQGVWKTKSIYHFNQDSVCEPDFILDISTYINQKFELIKVYKSQFYNPSSSEIETPISGESYLKVIKGKNAAYGRNIGVAYGEAFTVNRNIGISNLFNLI